MSKTKIKTIEGLPRKKVTIIQNVFPKKLIKFFPYEIVNQAKAKTLIEENSTSIIFVSQKNFPNLKKYHKFKKDKDGNYYFKVLAVKDVDYGLDVVNNLDSFDNKITTISSFKALTNEFFDFSKFEGMVFSPIKPFKFNLSTIKQEEMFTIEDIKEADFYNWEEHFKGDEMLFEFSAIPFRNHLAEFDNAKVLFTNRDIQKEMIYQIDQTYDWDNFISQNNDAITIGLEEIKNSLREEDGDALNKVFFGFNFFSLVNDFKILCNYTSKNLNKTFEGFLNLKTSKFKKSDYNVPCQVIPLKMSAINDNDQILMFVDWFDYDFVLPYFIAKKFENSNTLNLTFTDKDNKTIKLFPEIEDKKLIFDLITVTSCFQDNFNKFPRITNKDNPNYGKIDSSFKIGNAKLQILDVVNKECLEICDGLISSHMAKFPDFEKDFKRVFIFNSIINSLSQYIKSSKNIAKGNNQFHKALLPWYLECSDDSNNKIDYYNLINQADKNYGVKTNIKFTIKSFYFKEDYFKSTDNHNLLELPIEANLSKNKIIQSDRKISLPKIKNVIDVVEKTTNPADIEANEEVLKYLWFMNFASKETFTKIFVDSLQIKEVGKDKEVEVQIDDSPYGTIYSQSEIEKRILEKQPGKILVSPKISIVNSNNQDINVVSNSLNLENPNSFQILNVDLDDDFISLIQDFTPIQTPTNLCIPGRSKICYFYNETPIRDYDLKLIIKKVFGFPTTTINISNNTFKDRIYWKYWPNQSIYPVLSHSRRKFVGSFTFSVQKQSFSEARVKSSGIIFQHYFQERNVNMTRDDWYLFLSKKSINSQKHILSQAEELMEFEPLEKDFKINQIKEIIIKQIWGHVFKIFLYNPPRLKDFENYLKDSNVTSKRSFDNFLNYHKANLQNQNKKFIETIEIPLIQNQNETEIVVQKIIFV